jgi:hypothetical protein
MYETQVAPPYQGAGKIKPQMNKNKVDNGILDHNLEDGGSRFL